MVQTSLELNETLQRILPEQALSKQFRPFRPDPVIFKVYEEQTLTNLTINGRNQVILIPTKVQTSPNVLTVPYEGKLFS